MEKDEEEGAKGGAGTSSRVSCSNSNAAAATAPSQPSSSSNHLNEKRRMFSVELKPGQTTIISWKKLLKESIDINNLSTTKDDNTVVVSGGDPAPAAAAAVQHLEGELQDAQPSNRFSAVIEKIERLYMGDQSSDEEAIDDIQDDDQYDTEDSFIDDAELDEYFQVDKLSTKHNGYFVNRGKLEGIETSSSPNLVPKKRKRKDSTEVPNETKSGQVKRDDGPMGNKQIKAAARSAPFIAKELASPARIQSANGEHHQEGKILKHKINTFTMTSRSMNFTTNVENTSSGRIPKDVSSQSFESNRRKGILPSRDPTNKSRLINESVNPAQHESQDRAVGSQVESHSRKVLNCGNEAEISTKVRRKEAYGANGIPRMDSTVDTYPMQAVRPSCTQLKGGSTGRPKNTTLETAIRDLEKIVAFCRPQKLDIQEVDSSSQGVKRRLPQDVKQRLAKVARLSAGQSKISEDDLIDRLMGIVGHIVQRKTLKRNMREMAETGPSAKQQKSDRMQLIKKEINKMIMIRVSILKSKAAEQQVGSADDFQVSGNDDRRARRKYIMDSALEDKISELYDLYVEGIGEDKGSQCRKLFKELAQFWPNGYMDCNGIKDAISRSKERKRSRFYRHKVRDEERIKRKKLATAARVEETNRQEKPPSTNSTAPTEKVITTNQPIVSSSSLSDSGRHHISNHDDKARISSSSTSIVGNVKKMKRKPESDWE